MYYLHVLYLAVPRGQISAKRIYEVLDMPMNIKDPTHAIDIEAKK